MPLQPGCDSDILDRPFAGRISLISRDVLTKSDHSSLVIV